MNYKNLSYLLVLFFCRARGDGAHGEEIGGTVPVSTFQDKRDGIGGMAL